MMLSESRRSSWVAASPSKSKKRSRNVTSPTFSIAPAPKFGTATRSSFS
jgi:hypothetical protein